MTIRNLLLPITLCLALSSSATNSRIVDHFADNPQMEKDSCSLPAPSNFHVKEIAPTWVTLAWDAPATPRQHRIRIYRESDGVLLSTTTVPAGVSESTIGIPFDTPVYALINAICMDGSHSPAVAEARFNGLILDLIVNGHSLPDNSSSCDIVGSGSCPFGSDGPSKFKLTRFRYGNPILSQIFYVEGIWDTVEERMRYEVRQTAANSGNDYTLVFFVSQGDPATCSTSMIVVKYVQPGPDIVVATIDCSDQVGTNMLNANLYNSPTDYCQIDRLTPYGNGQRPSGARERESTSETSTLTATTAPNPFSQSLDVFLGQTSRKRTDSSSST
jgi:hypothetical protein